MKKFSFFAVLVALFATSAIAETPKVETVKAPAVKTEVAPATASTEVAPAPVTKKTTKKTRKKVEAKEATNPVETPKN